MNTSTCNSNLIEAFLADRLADDQQAAFERHLDECNSCCTELKRRTADDGLWNDARTYLSSSDHVGQASSLPSNNSRHPIPTDPCSSRDASLQLDFLAPTDDPRMLGRFAGHEISGVVGCGGMGIVLKGFDPALNRYAAIKVLSPHYATSGAARQRFAREAQAAAAVVHDNVIAIHGVSEFNNVPFLIMPYIKGQSLQKRIDRHGPLSTAEILRIAMQTARGLAAAHDQGLVHRDIKPANILLPENVERVMITDFGLARAADDASLTRSGVIAGTPQYMSPEQAKGEGIDSRSDLFSLGSTMYAMATGHPPFRAETPYGILRRITDHAHRPLQEVNPEIPSWLSRIVDRLLAKDASARFASADELAALLEDCLAHMQQPTVVELPSMLITIPPIEKSARRFQIRYAAIAMLLIIAAFIWMQWLHPERPGASHRSVNVGNDKQLPAASAEPLMEELQWYPDDELSSIESALVELDHELESPNNEQSPEAPTDPVSVEP